MDRFTRTRIPACYSRYRHNTLDLHVLENVRSVFSAVITVTAKYLKGHDHNVSAYSRVHILSRAVNFSLLAGPNSSEQKPNQSNKRLVCSYIAQRQQQKLGSWYFELFCNGLSSIMTRTVAYTSTLTYLTLALASWLFMDQV